MKTKLLAIAFVLAPSIVSATCAGHEQQAMSCSEGTVYDSASGTCVPQASS